MKEPMRRITREGGYFGSIERHCDVGGLVFATTTYRGPVSIPRHCHEYPSLFLSLRGDFLSTRTGENRLIRNCACQPPAPRAHTSWPRWPASLGCSCYASSAGMQAAHRVSTHAG